MKKYSAFVLALLLAATLLLPPVAYAAGTLTLTSVSGAVGEQVVVEVCLTSDDVCGGNFDVSFDSACLTLVSAARGSGGWFGAVNEKEPGLVKMSFAQTEPITEATLCLLTFRITADTPAEGAAVELENVRLYNSDYQSVAAEIGFGSVTRDCVWFTLTGADTVENQSVRAEVSLGGALRPAGGGFTLTYDSSVLQAVSVLPLADGANLQMSWNLDTPGEVRVQFAAAQAELSGTLCAVTFRAVGAAGSSTSLTMSGVRAYDEDSEPLDTAVSAGEVSIVLPSERDPKLWVVGGALEEDGSATASVLLQGRGIVCGGQLTLYYDPAMTAEVSVMEGAAVNHDSATGAVTVSWAASTPPAEAQTLLTLSFTGARESALTFGDDVRLYDGSGSTPLIADIRPGAVTASEQLVPAVDDASAVSTGSGTTLSLSLDLADTGYYTENGALAQVTPMLAVYEDGRFKGVVLADAVEFENGVAELTLHTTVSGRITEYRVFLVDGSEQVNALCAAVTGAVTAP